MEYLVRQTIKVSGINGIALTKLDVLDELDEIKDLCSIRIRMEKKLIIYPQLLRIKLKIKPIYQIFEGMEIFQPKE